MEIHVLCKGRDQQRNEVLPHYIEVGVVITSPTSTGIELKVKCPYNTGGHGHRCKASHPNEDKVGDGIPCAYAVDLPHAVDSRFAHEA